MTGDGQIDLSDLGVFGDTYNRCYPDPRYNCWLDINIDSCVDLSEFAYWSDHYQHKYDPPQQFKFQIEQEESDLIVQFEGENKTIDGTYKHLVTIYLEYVADKALMFMSLNYNKSILSFDKWNSNPSFPNRSAVAHISSHGHNWIATAAFKLDSYASNIVKMGTLEFTITDDTSPIGEDDIWINFADVLETNGKVKRIYGAQYFPGEEIPALTTRLSDNYPNPFNPVTVIEYSIAKDAHVNLSIYNVKGLLVCTLVDEFQKANHYKLMWNGKNNRGSNVASGVYFLRMNTALYTMTKKLVILR